MKISFKGQLSKEDEERWIEFWKRSGHAHPRQHPVLGGIEREKGRTPVYAMAEDAGAVCGVAVLSLRPLLPGWRYSGEVVCLRGPAFDDVQVGREFLTAIIGKMSSLRVGAIRISPDWLYPDALTVESLLADLNFRPMDSSPRTGTGLVDLLRDEESIFASFSKSTRMQIRLTARHSVEVRPLTTRAEMQMAHECFAANRRRLGLTRMSQEEFDTYYDRVLKTSDLGVLLGAIKDTKLLGALAVIRSRHTAHPSMYAINSTLARDLSNTSVGPSLWWEACRWARQRGCVQLDVEGGVTNEDPSHPLYEVANFKRRFSPRPSERMGEYIRTCSTALMTLHILGRKADSAWKRSVEVLYSRTRIKRGISRQRMS